jgi:hypothetical protein
MTIAAGQNERRLKDLFDRETLSVVSPVRHFPGLYGASDFQWGSVRYPDVHKADDPTSQQKKNHRAKYEQETGAQKHQNQWDQRRSSEHEYASMPLLFAGVESRMGRLKACKQQSQRNHIQHEQHDDGDAEDGGRIRLAGQSGQDKQLGAANQEG